MFCIATLQMKSGPFVSDLIPSGGGCSTRSRMSLGASELAVQLADGLEKPLEKADFMILHPRETAVCRTRTEAISLSPGRYRITININTINRINRIIYGFDQFCQENDLSVWLGALTSGAGTFTVQAMPSNRAQ